MKVYNIIKNKSNVSIFFKKVLIQFLNLNNTFDTKAKMSVLSMILISFYESIDEF